MTQAEEIAYWQGCLAYLNNINQKNNPYTYGSKELKDAWDRGWINQLIDVGDG